MKMTAFLSLLLVVTAASVARAVDLPSSFSPPPCSGTRQTVLASDDPWWSSGSPFNGPPVSADNAPNAFALANDFVSSLSVSGTEDFENVIGSTLTFGPFGSGSYTNVGGSITSATTNGYRATSGTQFWGMRENSLTITFPQPAQALGFYIVDALEQRNVTITCANGAQEVFVLDPSPPCSTASCNPVAYFASERDASDTGDWCTGITIEGGETSASDAFGIDDVTIGTCDALVPATAEANCDCHTACVGSSSGLSATLTFSETAAGPCPVCE